MKKTTNHKVIRVAAWAEAIRSDDANMSVAIMRVDECCVGGVGGF